MKTKTVFLCDACEAETPKNNLTPVYFPTISQKVDICPVCADSLEKVLCITGLNNPLKRK